jgi:hypothetical protein
MSAGPAFLIKSVLVTNKTSLVGVSLVIAMRIFPDTISGTHADS